MRSLPALILTFGVLLYVKLEYVSARPKAIIGYQSRIECGNGGCLKREYPWIEGITRKQQESLVLLNSIFQRRFNQPFFKYYLEPDTIKSEVENSNILMENDDQQILKDIVDWKTDPLLADRVPDLQQSWRENKNSVNDDSSAITDNTNFDLLEENINSSLAKRNYYKNVNNYSSLMALAGLEKNLTSENSKRTTGQIITQNEINSFEYERCSCKHYSDMKDMGEHYYPRHHKSYKCVPDSCARQLLSCKEKLFKIWVLKRREAGDPDRDRNISMLPDIFKKDFLFVERYISVACQCTL